MRARTYQVDDRCSRREIPIHTSRIGVHCRWYPCFRGVRSCRWILSNVSAFKRRDDGRVQLMSRYVFRTSTTMNSNHCYHKLWPSECRTCGDSIHALSMPFCVGPCPLWLTSGIVYILNCCHDCCNLKSRAARAGTPRLPMASLPMASDQTYHHAMALFIRTRNVTLSLS